MFIIVGHDKRRQQVMIHDTSDHTTIPASYDKVAKVVKSGYKINGLDAQGNIICNEINVFDELKVQLRPILAKALLLQLDKLKTTELIFPLCLRYGVVEKPLDLEVNMKVHTITFYQVGVSYHYKEDKIEQFHSVKHRKGFERLTEETQYMLRELYTIPLKLNPKDLIITNINQIYKNGYHITFKDGTLIRVNIHDYEKDFSTRLDKLDEITRTAIFIYYIRCLVNEKPKGPYFISQLIMW